MSTNPEMAPSAVLARVLDDMKFFGLIELKSDEDVTPASEAKSQPDNQHKMNKKAAADSLEQLTIDPARPHSQIVKDH